MEYFNFEVVHCDSCENAFDNPLLYEKGWGKKLSYVIAVGDYDVIDVTRRYTTDLLQLLPRRKLTTESRVAFHMMMLTREQRFGLPESMLKELKERDLNELKELQRFPKIDWSLMIGRQSGSLEWRTARGEIGNGE